MYSFLSPALPEDGGYQMSPAYHVQQSAGTQGGTTCDSDLSHEKQFIQRGKVHEM